MLRSGIGIVTDLPQNQAAPDQRQFSRSRRRRRRRHVTGLLRRKLASEFTAARTTMVPAINSNHPWYISRAKPQTVTRARARPTAAQSGALTIERREVLRHRIAARLAARPGSTVHDLQAAIGGNRDNLLKALRALTEDGTVTQQRDPADRRVRRYTLRAS